MSSRYHTVAVAVLALALVLPATAPAKWVQVKGPVLTASLPWEGKSVQEPTVLWEDGRYRMWYSGGFWTQRMGYAESTDGIHWRKRSQPIMWDATHSSIVKTRNGYMLFAGTREGDLTQAFSPDGIRITSRRTIVHRQRGWTSRGIANTFAWRSGTGWKLMYEALGDDYLWQTGLTSATKGASGWEPVDTPLRLNPHPGGMAGGVWRDGRCLYFHGTRTGVLPTKMYRRCGPNLHQLGPLQIVFGRQQSWQVDQVADPSIARAPGKPPLMLFSGVNNPKETGMIGAAWGRP